MVIVLKLINGDTVIGLLSLEDEEVTIIQDPFILEYRMDLKGNRSMVLHRYNPFCEESTVSFKESAIVSTYYADPDLSEYYFCSLDHSIKFRDQAMSHDIQRASEYLEELINNNNNIKPVPREEVIQVSPDTSSNTVH